MRKIVAAVLITSIGISCYLLSLMFISAAHFGYFVPWLAATIAVAILGGIACSKIYRALWR